MNRAVKVVLRMLVRGALRTGRGMEGLVPRRAPARFTAPASGVTVLIPERANAALLGECLQSVARAVASVVEPVQILVVVNGSPRADYAELEARHPRVEWIFDGRPLGFSGAVRRGVKSARHGWVYLLNNDMCLEPDALAEVLRWRAPSVFAVASQIFFKDTTCWRESWAASIRTVRSTGRTPSGVPALMASATTSSSARRRRRRTCTARRSRNSIRKKRWNGSSAATGSSSSSATRSLIATEWRCSRRSPAPRAGPISSWLRVAYPRS